MCGSSSQRKFCDVRQDEVHFGKVAYRTYNVWVETAFIVWRCPVLYFPLTIRHPTVTQPIHLRFCHMAFWRLCPPSLTLLSWIVFILFWCFFFQHCTMGLDSSPWFQPFGRICLVHFFPFFRSHRRVANPGYLDLIPIGSKRGGELPRVKVLDGAYPNSAGPMDSSQGSWKCVTPIWRGSNLMQIYTQTLWSFWKNFLHP